VQDGDAQAGLEGRLGGSADMRHYACVYVYVGASLAVGQKGYIYKSLSR
jgi:hypothetical protein